MQALGLHINDLNMFDTSRDMILAGWQHASRLEYSIEKVCIDRQTDRQTSRQTHTHTHTRVRIYIYIYIYIDICIKTDR